MVKKESVRRREISEHVFASAADNSARIKIKADHKINRRNERDVLHRFSEFAFGKFGKGEPNEIGAAKMQGDRPKIIAVGLVEFDDLFCDFAADQKHGDNGKGDIADFFGRVFKRVP